MEETEPSSLMYTVEADNTVGAAEGITVIAASVGTEVVAAVGEFLQQYFLAE
jgi:hypothetical protein